MRNRISAAFQQEDVRQKVIPAYVGLITQCDDQLGVLLDHLEETDRLQDTMIVLTSDHGDYLGDHWLGEKDLFHDPSVKVPMIIYDPRPEANPTRGTVCDALVEAIDLAPTFLDAASDTSVPHILEGRSLIPWLHEDIPEWRTYVVSDFDYSSTPQGKALGLDPMDCRLFMIFDGRFKLMHAEGGFRPMLFDLQTDPEEFHDLAKSEGHQTEIDRLYDHLADWGRRCSQRVTTSDDDIRAMRGASLRKGILPFLVDGSEVPEDLTAAYRGRAHKTYVGD
jgi:arylsulfatase A-like enzyme